MTMEQLAIVVPAAVAVLVVGISAWVQARLQRQSLESARTLALQDRVRDAYVELIFVVRWVMEIVDATKPIVDWGADMPQEPDLDRIRLAQARIGVHGSPEVKAILLRWVERRRKFVSAARLLDRMQTDAGSGVDVDKSYGKSIMDQLKEVESLRKELHEIVRELEDATNVEMRA